MRSTIWTSKFFSRGILIMVLLATMLGAFVPTSPAIAKPTGPDGETYWVDPDVNGVLMSQYLRLKHMFSRTRNDVNPLNKKLERILNNYKILQKKGSPSWDEMRVLYYDYNSAYQAAISHRWEAQFIIDTHYGITSKGKVYDVTAAKLTVLRLRGAVTMMNARIDDCHEIYRKAAELMKYTKAFTKYPK